MKKTEISQGPWTRIRPLQRDEMDPYTAAGMAKGEITWGNFRNNLCKVMAYLPRMMQTEVEYCNSFIFDPPTFRGDVQESGFNDRCLKELIISRVSLANRSRYSVTHHAFMGWMTFQDAGRGEEAHDKYLHLHEHEKHPETYTERERVVLDFVHNLTRDAHRVSDDDFAELRRVLTEHNRGDDRLAALSDEEMARYVDRQIVEITWLAGHYCSLNRFFTVLEVPDETEADEDNFGAVYEEVVPEAIRQRNETLLAGDF